MKLGFFAPHTGSRASREEIARACDVAEEGGADSLWAVDHIAIPYGFRAVYPYAAHQFGTGPDRPMPWWDCLSVLAYLAARTERVQLGTGVLILPYRHPVATAKALATVDQLSGGRVVLGAGVGWLEDEFDALGLDTFHRRGRVMDEQLEVIRRVWTDDRASYDGVHYRFPEISVTPRPAQRNGPPILVGGNSEAALRRAVRYGDGWHGLMLLPEEVPGYRARLDGLAAERGRADRLPITLLMGLHLTRDPSVYPALDRAHRQAAITGTPDQAAEQLLAYRAAGVEHLQLAASADATFGDLGPSDVMEFVLREIRPALHG